MSMLEWAEREVAIAIKDERGDRSETEWDYGVACYESALKAFKCLMEDGHSGMSISFTKNILNRLIDGKCLRPIEDTEDVWKLSYEGEDYTSYQCTRMSGLFKYVYKDGTVKYSDVDNHYCEDIHKHVTFSSGFVRHMLNELYPITMPYMPSSKPYKVLTEDFATTGEIGCYDSFAIYTIITPDGDKVEINKFYKEVEGERDLVEISEEEFSARRELYLANRNEDLYDEED